MLLRLGTAFLQLHPQKEQLLFRLGTFPFLGGDGFVKFRNLRLLGLQGFLLLCGVVAVACLLRCQSPDGFQIMVNIVLQHGDFALFGGGFAFVFGSVVSSLLRLSKTKIRLLEQRFDFSVQRFRLGHHPFMAAPAKSHRIDSAYKAKVQSPTAFFLRKAPNTAWLSPTAP